MGFCPTNLTFSPADIQSGQSLADQPTSGMRNSSIRTVPFPEECRSIPLDETIPRYTAPHEVQFLCWLARQTPGDILELGCNVGLTTRELALQCPDKRVFAVDYAGKNDTLCPEQKGEKPLALHIGHFARDLPNVKIQNLNSRQVNLTKKPLTTVRFIFIDGDHSYAGVKADTEIALAHLKRHGQVTIVWHDYREDAPEWMKVYEYLHREIAPHYCLDYIDTTWLVVLR